MVMMIRWFLAAKNLIRALDQKARDALVLYEQGGEDAAAAVKRYMQNDYEQLWDLWQQRFPEER
ncbi:MAG: hypothetical protein IH614_09125 [Desulfuromonadales bacterium]|nr:hypothetical protein [Desulfuromonadales bacterium]